MNTELICQNCEHFYQHYVLLAESHYSKCGSGHCVFPRRKLRYTDEKACQHFVPKETEDP